MRYLVLIFAIVLVSCKSHKKVVETRSEQYTKGKTVAVSTVTKNENLPYQSPTISYIKKYAPIAMEEISCKYYTCPRNFRVWKWKKSISF